LQTSWRERASSSGPPKCGYAHVVNRELGSGRRSARLATLSREVLRAQTAEQVGLSASGAAFWLVIAVLPSAIAAVSVYGLVVSPERVAGSLSGLLRNGPQSLGATLAEQLQKVAAADNGGLTVGLVVSLLLALWSASAGVYNLERAIRAAYGFAPEEYVRARARALIGAVVVVFGLGVVALASTAAAFVAQFLPVVVVSVGAVIVFVGVAAPVIAILYRYSVGHRLVLRSQLPGAVAASVGLGVVVAGFAMYLHFSARYTAVYGALAGTVIGMVGTYLAVYVVLLGAVLNAQLLRDDRA